MNKQELYSANTTSLAYVGDAVYEVFVRGRLFGAGSGTTKDWQRISVGYVSAAAQAKAMRGIYDGLDPEEQALVKRARNRQSVSKPKNADPVEYKWATALEALIGYLYLSEKKERLAEVMEQAWELLTPQGDQ